MTEDPKHAPPAPLALTFAHRNALSARLYSTEEDCREIEHWLEGVHGVYCESVGELSEPTKERIRGLLAVLRQRFIQIKLDLGLRSKELDVQQVVLARLSHLGVTVQECQPESLHSYGPVPEELKAYLDPHMDELLTLVRRLRAVTEGNPADGNRQ